MLGLQPDQDLWLVRALLQPSMNSSTLGQGPVQHILTRLAGWAQRPMLLPVPLARPQPQEVRPSRSSPCFLRQVLDADVKIQAILRLAGAVPLTPYETRHLQSSLLHRNQTFGLFRANGSVEKAPIGARSMSLGRGPLANYASAFDSLPFTTAVYFLHDEPYAE
jgi:hypothetical protein